MHSSASLFPSRVSSGERRSGAERKLQQIQVLAAAPDIAPAVARLGCAIVAAADDAGLLMLKSREMAAMAACEMRLATRHLRELVAIGLVQADARCGDAIALRVVLTGQILSQELDSRAKRLREARRVG